MFKGKLKSLFNFHAGRDRLVNLYNLHGDRVLGDIPICPENNIDPEEIMHAAKKAGLGALLVPREEAKDNGAILGTVYVYDRKRLQRLLDQNREMLQKAEWPQEANRFVAYLPRVIAPVNSEICDFIARCHAVNGGDPGWKPYREEDRRRLANQHQAAELSKMRYQALQKNDAAAANWVESQAATGHIGAMLDTSAMYARGAGFRQDYAQAAFWAGVVAKRLSFDYREMLKENDPRVRRIVGPDVQAGDSDAAISTAAAAHDSVRDYIKMRDDALSHLSPDQQQDVMKRVESWHPAPPPTPSSQLPPGFQVWK
jgi:hypothetical protein